MTDDAKTADTAVVAMDTTADTATVATNNPDCVQQTACLKAIHAVLVEKKRIVKADRAELKAVRARIMTSIKHHSTIRDELDNLITTHFPKKPKNALQLFTAAAIDGVRGKVKIDAAFLKDCATKWKSSVSDEEKAVFNAQYQTALQAYSAQLANVDVGKVLAEVEQLSGSVAFQDEMRDLGVRIVNVLQQTVAKTAAKTAKLAGAKREKKQKEPKDPKVEKPAKRKKQPDDTTTDQLVEKKRKKVKKETGAATSDTTTTKLQSESIAGTKDTE